MTEARKGDKVKIGGAYQHEAIHSGNTFQRNWHLLKLTTAVGMADIKHAANILDLGAGSGVLTSLLPAYINAYTGLDANPDAVSFANKTYGSTTCRFQLFQLDDLHSMPDSCYSHVFFLETIEHITAAQGGATLEHIYRILRPGGKCIISTPNRRSLWPVIETTLDLLRLTPRLKDEQHEKLYSPGELRKLGVEAGFTIQNSCTINGLAPWISPLGEAITKGVHRWEISNNWLPGSLIIMLLQKGLV